MFGVRGANRGYDAIQRLLIALWFINNQLRIEQPIQFFAINAKATGKPYQCEKKSRY
jgi:hypothetical protein